MTPNWTSIDNAIHDSAVSCPALAAMARRSARMQSQPVRM
jgi:hypothetical protein